MTFAATCRASVYRATTTNSSDDVIDDNTTPVVGLESIIASLIEKSRKVYDAATNEQRTIRWCVGRFTPGTDLRAGDRVKDNRTGKLYAVDEITDTPRGVAGHADLILDLRIL